MKCKDCPYVRVERMSNLQPLVIYGFCHKTDEPKLIGRNLDVNTVWFCPLRKKKCKAVT